jgi:hypothetical protein
MSENLRRIHNINEIRNRYLAVPIFVLAYLSLVALLFLPYRGRIVFAFLLNLFFNRWRVYGEYLSRWLLNPLRILHMAAAYFLIFLPYGICRKILGGRKTTGWNENPPPTTSSETMFRQS